ncbi:hypothetical protein GCM10027300_13430 [Modestobacter lapidis]|nr:hypothetical protein [Modestobacter lapidis]
MRRREVQRADSGELPPQELLRFRPSQTPPTSPDGRPMPWAVEWTADEFAAFLRARAAWRNSHSSPLPGLLSRERHAMHRLHLPRALVDAEGGSVSGNGPPL